MRFKKLRFNLVNSEFKLTRAKLWHRATSHKIKSVKLWNKFGSEPLVVTYVLYTRPRTPYFKILKEKFKSRLDWAFPISDAVVLTILY